MWLVIIDDLKHTVMFWRAFRPLHDAARRTWLDEEVLDALSDHLYIAPEARWLLFHFLSILHQSLLKQPWSKQYHTILRAKREEAWRDLTYQWTIGFGLRRNIWLTIWRKILVDLLIDERVEDGGLCEPLEEETNALRAHRTHKHVPVKDLQQHRPACQQTNR